jgi:hypothetical protein
MFQYPFFDLALESAQLKGAWMSDQVFVASRVKLVLFVLGAAVFSAIGVMMIRSPGDDPRTTLFGWAAIAFFGLLGIPVMLIQIVRPGRLILGDETLVMETSFGKRFVVPWRDVESFGVWNVARSKQVGYRYYPDRRPNTLAQSLTDGMGVDGALGTAWPIKSKDLLTLLEARRIAALGPPAG